MSLSNPEPPVSGKTKEARQENSESYSDDVYSLDAKDTTSTSSKYATSSPSESTDLSLDDSDKEREDISDSGSDYSNYTLRPLSVIRKRTTHTANTKAFSLPNQLHLTAPHLPLKNHLTSTQNYINDSDRESNVIDSEDDRRSENSTSGMSTSRSSNNISTEKNAKRDKKRERPSRYSHTFLVHTSIRASPLSKEV
ncbi:hypothetical protein HK096_001219 [Nowakowskiella sp. JEL0078]|nr:hypothetical protein HK096_001219 [Nowakowskiella sp. JEL0078]